MFPVQFPQLQLLSDHFLHTKHSQAPITSWLPYTGQERSQVRVWANLLFLRIKIFCVLPPNNGGDETWFLFQLSLIAGMGKPLFEKSIPVIWLRIRPSWLVKLKFSAQVNNVVFSHTSSYNLEPDYHEAVLNFVHLIRMKKNLKACHCILELSLMLP